MEEKIFLGKVHEGIEELCVELLVPVCRKFAPDPISNTWMGRARVIAKPRYRNRVADRRPIMASPDLVIDYHKLDTKFFADHVQHTTFRSDASQGRRRVKVVKKWYRDRELGRGSFGTVFLERSEKERSEKGEYRAVKEIAKDKNSRIMIDYKRELTAMAILTKVRDIDAPRTVDSPSLANHITA